MGKAECDGNGHGYRVVKDFPYLDRLKGLDHIPRYEYEGVPEGFERREDVIKKLFELRSGNRLIMSCDEYRPDCYTFDILIVPKGIEYKRDEYWNWFDDDNPGLIKGDGSIEGLREAYRYLKDEVIPTLRRAGAKELWVSTSEKKRSRAFSYVKRLGFEPMIEIQRDDGGRITYQGDPEYVYIFEHD